MSMISKSRIPYETYVKILNIWFASYSDLPYLKELRVKMIIKEFELSYKKKTVAIKSLVFLKIYIQIDFIYFPV